MKQSSKSKNILFVYNADSGVSNMLLDYGKKYLQPSKYDCQLCMVTYGALGMKKDWKAFTRSLPHPVTFLHRDEFEKLYPSSDFKFPAVIVDNSGYLKVVINNSDFDTIHSLEELKTKLTAVI